MSGFEIFIVILLFLYATSLPLLDFFSVRKESKNKDDNVKFLIRSVNHYKVYAEHFERVAVINKEKCKKLENDFNHMRQSKIFWKNKCRSLELKVKKLEGENE